MVLEGATRRRAGDRPGPVAEDLAQALTSGGATVVRRSDVSSGSRPQVPEPGRAVRGDRRGTRVTAIGRVATLQAGLRGRPRGGGGDPGGPPGPAGPAAQRSGDG